VPTASSAPPILDLAAIRLRPVVTVLEERLGRPIRGRLLSTDTITRVKPPGLSKLHTNGPLTHRHVVLEDSLPPHLRVAVAWALTVEGRLPLGVRAGLVGSGEPLDRLLTSHDLPWTADLIEDVITGPASTASTHFTWAASGTPLVEITRILQVSDDPIAITIDEVPLLPELGADTPLVPLPG
jgi:hypothetical protein